MERDPDEPSSDAGLVPSFSVVVVTHERERFVRESIASIEDAVAAYPGDAEIIAVDSSRESVLGDTSTDVTGIHVPDANKVTQKRNIGMCEATGDWIVYVDDDCTVAEQTLDVVASAIQDGDDEVAGYYPVTEFVGERTFPFECCVGTPFLEHFEWPRQGADQTWGPGAMAIFEREALLAVDGFDESFASVIGGEDIDIGIRLTERGYRLVGIPETLVYHTTETWNSFWGNCRRFFEYGRGEVEVVRRHPERSHFKLDAVTPLVVVTVVSTVLASIAWGYVGLLVPPLFGIYSTLITAGNYRRAYEKPFGQTLVLRVYDYANAAGNVENSRWVIPTDCFRLKPGLNPNPPYPLGREYIVYPDEFLTYLGLPFALLTVYLLTVI